MRGQLRGFSGRERLQASQLLFERGFGKPVETTVLIDASKAEEKEAFSQLPSETLQKLLNQLAPPAGAALGEYAPGHNVEMPDLVGGVTVADAEYTVKEINKAREQEAELIDAGIIPGRFKKDAETVLVKIDHPKPSKKNRFSTKGVYDDSRPDDSEPDTGGEE